MKLKISELGKVITGNTPSKKIKEFWDKDDVGFVKPDIISDEHIVKIKSEDCNEFISNAAISKARIVPKNSIFVTCIGNIGKIGVATENLAFNQQINAIIPNENVNLDYLCYAIFANKTRLQDIANAPIVPLLNKSQFSEFELEFDMDINTQTRIVHELNTVSNIILKYKQELLLLDELVRARFVEMFGDPRINEKKWKAGKIVDYFEVKGGKRIPKGMGYAERKTNHPYLRASDMKNATILDDDIHYIDEEVYKRIKRYTVNAHDIYLTNVGVNLGMAGVIPKQYDGANLTENAVKLVPKDKILLNGMFLSYYINSPGIQHYINERKMSVGVPKLAIFRIESMPLLLPPLELQNQFASFVEEIDKSRSRIQKSLEASQELFDSLMQEYFG